MNNWDKYDEKRKFKIASDVLVIKPASKETITPLFCEVCEFTMNSAEDFFSFKDFGCCEKCKLHLVSRDQEGWLQGKRPDAKIIKEYVQTRKESFKPVFRFS